MINSHLTQSGSPNIRRVFMVLSPRSLVYARLALESLFHNSAETIHLHLITDSQSDKDQLTEELTTNQKTGRHSWSVYAEDELEDHEASQFARYPNLRLFRKGHPCWRKITDPVLLSAPGEEMVLLDPDLYFPNRFRFEPTLNRGLLLMWQKPNCLFPPEIVCRAMQEKIPLAHHVDIGVANWRGPVDLQWIDWLIQKLDCNSMPRFMHIEAIVWAALAMRMGGGHLDPGNWHCWHRSQTTRLMIKFGSPGSHILRSESFPTMKCFHAGGEAKYWLAEAKQGGLLEGANALIEPGKILAFTELTPSHYHRQQSVKRWLARFGYYNVIQPV
jgi:hypothetical protein